MQVILRLTVLLTLVFAVMLGPVACDDGFEPVSKEPTPPADQDTPDDAVVDAVDTPPATMETDAPTVEVSDDVAEWTEPDDRWKMGLDYAFKDQNGTEVSLSDFRGKPIVASFIFTRCANPEMCPKVVAKFASMQRDAQRVGVGDDVWFLLISFDPEYDTPEKLKAYGQERGVRFTNARMLVPSGDKYRDFIVEYQVRAGKSPTGELNHAVDLIMLDHKGGLARNEGGMWTDARVVADLVRLVEEQRAAQSKAG